jgi:hypothetical protein
MNTMDKQELERFNEANKIVHPVCTQWHYPIMIKFGYIAVNKTDIGFVRHYVYHHPTLDHKVTCSTGASADHWQDNKNHFGYWSDLEPRLVAEAPCVA